MKRRILNSAFAAQHRRIPGASLPQLVRRLATPSVEPSAARVLPPLGVLWDSTLLSRLQAPLTRFRE
jgi:hypothetical protein